ncbi:RHS repeat-associated core domain-containing protein [Aquimarina mytili]|uniref:RHS repeat-associated core domain-containing protein n=1 Tax=Aquimarina mytili TaxID=874423 RepID=A0A937A3E3_9FLAO|nr:RHS repeat-associated core domain-containing protein [Aquimarina mytili]MBL0686146.1 hypothetical protein [Aquimarina mytili]
MGQPEGYIEKESTSSGAERYRYIYQYADHLGNIRLSYSDKNNDGAVTQDEIIEESNYYPFGLKHKGYNSMINGRSHQYKYNNTELEEGLGLNWYEMPLRSYDPTIARWNRQDPVIHHGLSTYNAFDNNPIYYADPSGGNSEPESPWNRDNRENTLDSGGRGSFGFYSVAGSGGIHYNSYTGQYEDRLGRAVSYREALTSVGLTDTNRNNQMSGLAMLSSALSSLKVRHTIHYDYDLNTIQFGDRIIGSDPVGDIEAYEENDRIIIRNSMILDILGKLTNVGQLKSVIMMTIEEWQNSIGVVTSRTEAEQMLADLDEAFTILGITATTARPQLKVGAMIISTPIMTDNMYRTTMNEYVYGPRIKEHSPHYYHHNIESIPYYNVGGPGPYSNGGGGAGGSW